MIKALDLLGLILSLRSTESHCNFRKRFKRTLDCFENCLSINTNKNTGEQFIPVAHTKMSDLSWTPENLNNLFSKPFPHFGHTTSNNICQQAASAILLDIQPLSQYQSTEQRQVTYWLELITAWNSRWLHHRLTFFHAHPPLKFFF